MELCSLHPVSDELTQSYVRNVKAGWGGPDYPASMFPQNNGAAGLNPDDTGQPPILNYRQINALTFGLGGYLASAHPAYAADGLSLTGWEARIDRGLAMLVRPPSRLFIDAGLPAQVARRMPIRLDLGEGMMGGGYIPARLIPDAEALLERNFVRSVRRMSEAEMDAVSLQGLMMEAVSYARVNGLGLYEVAGLIDYANPASWPREFRVRNRPSARSLQDRIAVALQPESKPGAVSRLWSKLTGKGT